MKAREPRAQQNQIARKNSLKNVEKKNMLVSRLNYQPLFGKRARAPPSSRGGT